MISSDDAEHVLLYCAVHLERHSIANRSSYADMSGSDQVISVITFKLRNVIDLIINLNVCIDK